MQGHHWGQFVRQFLTFLRWYAPSILLLNLVWIGFPQAPLQSRLHSVRIQQRVWTVFSLCDLHSWKLLCMTIKSLTRWMEIKTAQERSRDLTGLHPVWKHGSVSESGPRPGSTQCRNRDLRGFQILKICTEHPRSADGGLSLLLVFWKPVKHSC